MVKRTLRETKKPKEIVRTRTKEFDDTVDMCKRRQELLEEANRMIKEKQAILKQEQFVARVYETELSELHRRAEQLLSTTKVLSMERGVLQDKLQKQFNINATNHTTGRGAVLQVLEMLNEISQESEKMKISDQNTHKLCKEDLNDLKVELQRPLSDVRKLLEIFDAHRLEELSMTDEMVVSVNKYIRIIRQKTFDMKAMMDSHFGKLEQFAAETIGAFVKEFKLICHNYTHTVQNLVECIHDTLAAEDVCLSEKLKQLQHDIETRSRQEELMYKKQVELNTKILDQLKDINNQILQRNFQEKRKQLLYSLTHETEKSTTQTEGMIESLQQTITNELAAVPTESVPDAVLADLNQLEHKVDSLSAHSDETRQRWKSIRASITTKMEEVSEVLDTQINIVDSRFDFLMDDRDTFQRLFQNFLLKTDQILKTDFLQKIVPVKHEGDTPARRTIVLANTIERPAPREVLINRFKQECPLPDTEENEENLPPDE